MKDLTELLHLHHWKQERFQKAADNLAFLEEDLNGCQSRVEDAICSYMGLQHLYTLVIHSPHLPVEEVWLCRIDTSGTLEMTVVTQIQACAINEILI